MSMALLFTLALAFDSKNPAVTATSSGCSNFPDYNMDYKLTTEPFASPTVLTLPARCEDQQSVPQCQ